MNVHVRREIDGPPMKAFVLNSQQMERVGRACVRYENHVSSPRASVYTCGDLLRRAQSDACVELMEVWLVPNRHTFGFYRDAEKCE